MATMASLQTSRLTIWADALPLTGLHICLQPTPGYAKSQDTTFANQLRGSIQTDNSFTMQLERMRAEAPLAVRYLMVRCELAGQAGSSSTA